VFYPTLIGFCFVIAELLFEIVYFLYE